MRIHRQQVSTYLTLPPVLLGAVMACATGVCDEPVDVAIAEVDAQGIEFFEKHVRPVLVEHCYECHAAAEVNGGLRVDSRAGLAAGGDTGAAIVSGKPDQSLLIEAVDYQNHDLQMPPQNKLTESQIAALRKWVKMGAPDPRTTAVAPTATGPTGMSIEDGRRFWSFLPVLDSDVPTVAGAADQTPIDAFLLRQLAANNLQPAEQADKRTLIRRVTYDLTGLPPTQNEIAAFLADESDDAFANVVERLLSSPQYGVRWGRHWLDVARYADSNGLDENLAFGNAWRYRDYVVDAFNNDKPFDRFLTEQIAGDLLPDATLANRTATGFLVLGAKVLAEPDKEKLEMDTIDEQLDTIGKAFMGLTIGCVRCHDHKFDPLKQTDYYALAAILKSTRTFAASMTGAIHHWNEHSFATADELENLKQIDAEIKKRQAAASSFKNAAIAKIKADSKAKATEYLLAATRFGPETPFSVVEEIAAEFGLHARILHHCRTHLKFAQDDPFFGPWSALANQGESAVADHYRPLFAAALGGNTVSAPPVSDQSRQSALAALNDGSGFLAVPPKVQYAFDAESLAEYDRLAEEARIYESQAADEPAVLSVGEQETLSSLPINIRGSHLNLGDPVQREFPEVMRVSAVRPVFPKQQSGRLQLAQWMAGTQHPLTARVFVNRVWGWHFGRGLVGTPENFGRLGDRPTHPELLDWLAIRFMESGWSVKALHRLILSSRAYQMSSTGRDEAAEALDPENKLLWKFRIRRLEAEEIRDAILAVSSRLDTTLGGKTVPLRNRQFVFNHTSEDHTKYDSVRRSLYLPIIRNNLYTLFEQFDFPDPTMPTGLRNSTVVAPQALLMMNSDLVIESARSLVAQMMASDASSDVERIAAAYQETLGRFPTDAETVRAVEFLDELTAVSSGSTSERQQQAWLLLCQSLFSSNEFIYLR